MYFSTIACAEVLEVGVHEEAEGFALAQGAAVEQVGVGHRPPLPRVPVGLGAHDVEQGREPAVPVGRGVGHHQLAGPVHVRGDGAHVFEGDRPAEDGRSMVASRGRAGRLGGREVVAAEVELVGHVALARIDVLAVEVALAARARRTARGSSGST